MEYYKATEVDGLIRHLSSGVNKHMPIAKDYISEAIEKHVLEVITINE